MAFSRAAALRTAFRGARPSTVARPQLWRQVARRGYASGGHESAKAGGDAVWAAVSIAVTVPSCWYLLQNGPDTSSHGHDDHSDSHHGKSHDSSSGEDKEEPAEDKEEESKDDADEKSEEKSEEKTGKKTEKKAEKKTEGETDQKSSDEGKSDDSDDDSEKADTPDTSDDEEHEEKKVKKGANDGGKDKAASSKPAGSQNTQSGKQEGLSNTDTKHPSDPQSDQKESKKGEGHPDSAKAKGTVDPKRPQK